MKKEIALYLQGITETGCCAYFSIKINEDYTMRQVVEEVKRWGYVKFRLLGTMKRFADVT